MREISLTNGGMTLVDDDDFAFVSQSSWHQTRAGYARRGSGGKGTERALHRILLAAKRGEEVDHINGDPLDNRRANLRKADRTGNARNVGPLPFRKHGTRFKGISPCRGRWRAFIYIKHAQVFVGNYDTPEAAARAYDRAASEAYGPFARLNFPEEKTA